MGGRSISLRCFEGLGIFLGTHDPNIAVAFRV
jgi:hypothetical protein